MADSVPMLIGFTIALTCFYYCLCLFFFSSCVRFMTHHQTVVEDVKITVAPDDLGTNTNTQTQLVEVELGL